MLKHPCVKGGIWIIEEGARTEAGDLLEQRIPFCERLPLSEALRRLKTRRTRPGLIFLAQFPGKGTIRQIASIKEVFPEALVLLVSNWTNPEEANRLFARSLLETLRPAAKNEEPQNTYHLSTREFEILKCMVQGLIKKEIGEKLSISYHTVDNHQRNIFKKLNVHTRSAAVAKALMEKLC